MKQLRRHSLKPDSLAHALFHSAHLVASVLEGANLTVCYERLLREHTHWKEGARGAIRALTWGTLRDYGRGDATLRHFLSKPLPVSVRALLLVAVHDFEQCPEQAHTLVNQAVEAAACLAEKLKGVVNGVLRNVVRQRANFAGWREADETAFYSYPLWWIERVRREHKDGWEAILAAGNLHPPMSVRVNRRQCTVEEYLSELGAAGMEARLLDNDALLLARPVPVSKLPGFADGRVSVQDAGAQWAASLLGARDGDRVLDACAAPGGKSAHLLELFDIELTAVEIDPERAVHVQGNLDRLGLSASVVTADCAVLDSWWDGRQFDRILADVPCSASGVVRRHPDIKWLRRERDIQGFVAQQTVIVDALWHILANGGTMLYITCSVFDDENRRQIERFLVRHPNAELCEPDHSLPPTSDHDGFYYASLRKKSRPG